MESIKVSIILPVYNGSLYLSKSIESCINQTYSNIEIILVNDCSTDNTLEICQAYAQKDKRIHVINNLNNLKLPKSLNIGHIHSTSDLITWTSHDNIFAPNAIKFLLSNLDIETDIVYSDYFEIDEDGKVTGEKKLPEIDNLIFNNCIGASFLYRKKVWNEIGGYNEELYKMEDYFFWISALASGFKYKKIITYEPIYFYRVHELSLTAELFNKNNKLEAQLLKGALYSTFLRYYLKDSYTEQQYKVFTEFLLFNVLGTDFLYHKNIIYGIASDLENKYFFQNLSVKLSISESLYILYSLLNNKQNHNFKTFLLFFIPLVRSQCPKRKLITYLYLCFK